MPSSTIIAAVRAREVLDSRGNPTVEVDVHLDGGAMGRAIVPSGASTGRHEAIELRDSDPARYEGKGVLRAVAAVNTIIAPAACGSMDAADQPALDEFLRELDGTSNKSRLGANAILGVSLAAAHAAAAASGLPLYQYLGGSDAVTMPVPMVNIISGGRHAAAGLDMQDFLAIPIGAETYGDALRMVVDVYRAVGRVLSQMGPYAYGVADEGGYGPPLPCHEDALGILYDATRLAGYRCARDGDIAIGMDVAATEFIGGDGNYLLRAEGRSFTSTELADLLAHWCVTYPIISIEDGLSEDDWEGWEYLTQQMGASTQLIGDDLFTTNPERLARGADAGIANAVLIKLNQIGTLTETLETVRLAQQHGYLPVISARSGETEDTTIADLAVATGAGQIKIGSITRSERLAKYNRLLRIEEELGERAVFPGRDVFTRFLG
ncbi:MAG: phosphopyruvate hydratase [Chloroflexota bacterium]|nr:phosphopyruvate hydratase [Chloroflexota bacterium]MDE2683109.1 phosphopyruvate hydratase [Chloroflexota bacterium]